MVGLFLSQVILFVVAGLIGFAIGWRAFAMLSNARAKADERENDELRHLLTDAQVRRARGP